MFPHVTSNFHQTQKAVLTHAAGAWPHPAPLSGALQGVSRGSPHVGVEVKAWASSHRVQKSGQDGPLTQGGVSGSRSPQK